MFTREQRKRVKFAHFNLARPGTFGYHNGKHEATPKMAVATVAAIRYQGTWYCGVSFCAPNDNFSRADGRRQAYKKLVGESQADICRVSLSGDFPRFNDVAERAVRDTFSGLRKLRKDSRWYLKSFPLYLERRTKKSFKQEEENGQEA